jgi:hypothetical protein
MIYRAVDSDFLLRNTFKIQDPDNGLEFEIFYLYSHRVKRQLSLRLLQGGQY